MTDGLAHAEEKMTNAIRCALSAVQTTLTLLIAPRLLMRRAASFADSREEYVSGKTD
jgi:hypothetical protein